MGYINQKEVGLLSYIIEKICDNLFFVERMNEWKSDALNWDNEIKLTPEEHEILLKLRKKIAFNRNLTCKK